MKDRIQHIMHSRQLTSARFADDLGVPRSTISHILSGRNKPSLEFVMKVLDTYPEITAEWLLYGKGEGPEGDERDLFGGYGTAPGLPEEPDKPMDVPAEEMETTVEEGDAIRRDAGGLSGGIGRRTQPGGSPGMRRSMADMAPEKVLVFYPDGSFSCHYPRTAIGGESFGKAP